MFFVTFGLSEIVDSHSRSNVSYLRHSIQTVEFNFVEVELSDGSMRVEALVENSYSYTSYPLEIPRTFARKVFWIEPSHFIILLGIPFRPQRF